MYLCNICGICQPLLSLGKRRQVTASCLLWVQPGFTISPKYAQWGTINGTPIQYYQLKSGSYPMPLTVERTDWECACKAPVSYMVQRKLVIIIVLLTLVVMGHSFPSEAAWSVLGQFGEKVWLHTRWNFSLRSLCHSGSCSSTRHPFKYRLLEVFLGPSFLPSQVSFGTFL